MVGVSLSKKKIQLFSICCILILMEKQQFLFTCVYTLRQVSSPGFPFPSL